MKRKDKFSFRVNQEEREQISRLSKILQRSQSDALRYIISRMIKANQSKNNNYISNDSFISEDLVITDEILSKHDRI